MFTVGINPAVPVFCKNPQACEKAYGMAGVKTLQGHFGKEQIAAVVMAYVLIRVGHIAFAVSGCEKLFSRPVVLFQYSDTAAALCRPQGGHQAGGASPYNTNIHMLISCERCLSTSII